MPITPESKKGAYLPPPTPEMRQAAVGVVTRNARSVVELDMFMDMLGLDSVTPEMEAAS